MENKTGQGMVQSPVLTPCRTLLDKTLAASCRYLCCLPAGDCWEAAAEDSTQAHCLQGADTNPHQAETRPCPLTSSTFGAALTPGTVAPAVTGGLSLHGQVVLVLHAWVRLLADEL